MDSSEYRYMTDNMTDVIILGAGLSGLCTAHFLLKHNPALTLQILEKTDRPGGAIQSMKKDGFLAEWGPHGFLDNTPENQELIQDLKIEQQVQKAPLKQFVRYICLNGKLVKIPQTPPTIIKSNLLSLPSKLRVLADLWKKPLTGEHSIAQWVDYRFGKALLPFADMVLTGTYAGDIEKLSIDAAMPGLRKLELEHGSVFRGAIQARKGKRSSGMPSMISFEHGMEFLVQTLAAGKTIRYQTAVKSIEPDEDGWIVKSKQQQFKARQVVVAMPINGALSVLHSLAQPFKNQVPEAIVNNIALGFDSSADIPFGFGYLTPKSENRFALGTLFSIHMFPKRAPEGLNLIEVLVGGTRNPEHSNLDDRELINRAVQDVSQLLHIPKQPVFKEVIRPSSGIPQLELGHLKLIKYKDDLQHRFKGLFINGFGWEGIGMNDMIKQAKKTAGDALLGQSTVKQPAQAKPIYF